MADLMARLVESTEAVYSSEMRVVQMRREVLRDLMVQDALQAAEIT